MAVTRKKPLKKIKINLKYIYWCHTNLPEDYFFIYASSMLQAKKTYNWLGGFEGNANIVAHKICRIPENVLKELKIKDTSEVAENELVLKSGIEFLHKDGSAFRYNGKIYREAGITDDKHENNELTLYLFKAKEKSRYKIGHSKDISRRLKEVSKPDQFKILFTIPTKNARKLETELRGYFKRFEIYNEYIELDKWGSLLLEAIFMLYSTEFSKSDLLHEISDMFENTHAQLTEMIQDHKINIRPGKEIEKKGLELYKKIEDRSKKHSQELWDAHIKKLMRPSVEK